MRHKLIILFLLMPLLAEADLQWAANSVGTLTPNYTNVYLVNMTGGDAYKGWNVTNQFIDINGMHAQWTQLTASQKDVISTNVNNTTIPVISMGSGFGGQDCSAKSGNTISCTSYSISTCPYMYQYNVDGAQACMWTGVSCVGGGQPCQTWPFFEFIFSPPKANATSFTVQVNLQSATSFPTCTVTAKLYFWNYGTSAWDFITSGSGSCSSVFAVSASTTNLSAYMNSNGQITAAVIGQATSSPTLIPNMSCYYARCAVAYNGVIQ
jgi:hypothetical protein